MELAGAFLKMVGPSAWKGPRMPLCVSAARTAPVTLVKAAAWQSKQTSAADPMRKGGHGSAHFRLQATPTCGVSWLSLMPNGNGSSWVFSRAGYMQNIITLR